MGNGFSCTGKLKFDAFDKIKGETEMGIVINPKPLENKLEKDLDLVKEVDNIEGN